MGTNVPIGIAYQDQDITGAAFLQAASVQATDVFGYTSAARGAVTQATDKSTGVTLNKPCGTITMNAAALATVTNVSFTLTNSYLSASDAVILTLVSGAATPGTYTVTVTALAAGSATITLRNISGGTLSEAVVLNFVIINVL